ncbi:MAG TPA: transporter [Chitinivibrionales bacterium]|nr:transporter [Chitinivibrionales bacterium]
MDYHHWEVYGASQISSNEDGVSGTAPHVEVNFGIFRQTQIHLIVPLAFNHPRTGVSTYGPGDIELGLKFRFINETPVVPQIGVFPLIEIPTGNAAKGLGAGNTQVFLPLWLQKSWGSWTTYGGGGYLINITPDPANSWFVGWEAQHDFSEHLTVGAEAFGTVFPSKSAENELGFNIGAIVNFTDNHHLLLSAGRDIVGHNDIFLYAAYQYTIGPPLK